MNASDKNNYSNLLLVSTKAITHHYCKQAY